MLHSSLYSYYIINNTLPQYVSWVNGNEWEPVSKQTTLRVACVLHSIPKIASANRLPEYLLFRMLMHKRSTQVKKPSLAGNGNQHHAALFVAHINIRTISLIYYYLPFSNDVTRKCHRCQGQQLYNKNLLTHSCCQPTFSSFSPLKHKSFQDDATRRKSHYCRPRCHGNA